MINFYPACRPCFSPFALEIPTAFAESYSYSEMICKLADIIKALSEKIENNDQELINYVDEQIEALKNYVDNNINDVNNSINNQINRVLLLLQDIRDYVNIKSDNNLNECKALIYNLIGDCVSQTSVINPILQTPDCLQNTLNELYEALRFGLTCSQYDVLGLTAQKYDDKQIMAYRFDLYGYFLLFNYVWSLYSPFSGKKVTHQQAILELAQFNRVEGLTAQSYDGLNISAEQFINRIDSAYCYDWEGVKS